MIVQHSWVRTDLQGCQTTIQSPYRAESACEALHLGKFADIVAFTNLLRFSHQVSIDIDGVRVEPSHMLTVGNSAQHVVLVIPAEGVDHVANFLDLWLVDKRQEHVTIVVNEGEFSLYTHVDLIQLHFDDLS